jgi:hypothetical protein
MVCGSDIDPNAVVNAALNTRWDLVPTKRVIPFGRLFTVLFCNKYSPKIELSVMPT